MAETVTTVAGGKADPFIMIRLWPRHHQFPDDLSELIQGLSGNPGACDEVWFCTQWGFPSLEVHRQHAELIAAASERIRALGILPGLQIANTIGHGTSPLFPEEAADWPLMTDENGKTGFPAPCPRSPAVLRYIDAMSRIYAAARLSSAWIDDDLRISHHGAVGNACFCDICMEEFSAHVGNVYTRKNLVSALHQPHEGSLRLTWTKFNGESLAGVARTIARAFHEVSPCTRLGFQQIQHETSLDNGPDWAPIHEALALETGLPTGARLGSGFYTDHHPRQMIKKAFFVARQVARLPETVQQICPEVENFTHNRFSKTPYGTVLESSLYLAMGCNSLSYAILASDHESVSYHSLLLGKIVEYRPFWEAYVQRNLNTMPAGIEVVLGMDHVIRAPLPDDPPFRWGGVDFDRIYQLASLGLPLCTSSMSASAAILHDEAVLGLSDEELKQLLTRGVMMNGAAAMLIQERGMGELLGVSVSRIDRVNVYERMSSDPLNGEYRGKSWMLWLDSSSPAFMLRPLSASARCLGEYVDPEGSTVGVATSLAENAIGGRVAVFGYFDWVSDPSSARRNQYLSAADWVSRDRLSVVLHSLAQVLVVPRVDSAGALVSVFLLNVSIEPVQSLDIECRGVASNACQWVTPDAAREALESVPGSKGSRYATPSLGAWSCAYIEFS